MLQKNFSPRKSVKAHKMSYFMILCPADKSQPQAQRPANALGGKEFDPLSSQKSWEEQAHNKVSASFGMDGSG